MIRDVGLWIDRRKAVIVTISHDGEGIGSLRSTMEKQVCFSDVVTQDGWMGNVLDRRFADFFKNYYDQVIASFPDADSIQIFGPGEVKLQLEKLLRREELGERIVSVETVDKMTDRQIEAKVWKHYLSILGRTDVLPQSG